jgi:hypothetical protein
MEQYPWRFDSIHSHCHDDVISILNILKNFQRFWAIAHLRGVFKKNRFERELASKNKNKNKRKRKRKRKSTTSTAMGPMKNISSVTKGMTNTW